MKMYECLVITLRLWCIAVLAIEAKYINRYHTLEMLFLSFTGLLHTLFIVESILNFIRGAASSSLYALNIRKCLLPMIGIPVLLAPQNSSEELLVPASAQLKKALKWRFSITLIVNAQKKVGFFPFQRFLVEFLGFSNLSFLMSMHLLLCFPLYQRPKHTVLNDLGFMCAIPELDTTYPFAINVPTIRSSHLYNISADLIYVFSYGSVTLLNYLMNRNIASQHIAIRDENPIQHTTPTQNSVDGSAMPPIASLDNVDTEKLVISTPDGDAGIQGLRGAPALYQDEDEDIANEFWTFYKDDSLRPLSPNGLKLSNVTTPLIY